MSQTAVQVLSASVPPKQIWVCSSWALGWRDTGWHEHTWRAQAQRDSNAPSFRGIIALKVRIHEWGKSWKPILAASGSELDRIQPAWSRGSRAVLVCLHLLMLQTAIPKVRRIVFAILLTQAAFACTWAHRVRSARIKLFYINLFFYLKSHIQKHFYGTIGGCWSVLSVQYRPFRSNSAWHNLRAWTKLNCSCTQHKMTGHGS